MSTTLYFIIFISQTNLVLDVVRHAVALGIAIAILSLQYVNVIKAILEQIVINVVHMVHMEKIAPSIVNVVLLPYVIT